MNTYKISYKSPEMEEMRTTTVTAPDQRAAERAFNASYKHISLPAPDIFKTELIAENTTATKQQERDALEKIRKIVAELGPDSYIATAFAGCFEIAEENIENDFADSMKARAEAAEKEAHRTDAELASYKSKVAELEKDITEKDAKIASLKSELANASEIAIHNAKQCDEARNDIGECQRRAEEAEAEVIRLKAKLYDYIVAGA